jgi:hypothetical protein
VKSTPAEYRLVSALGAVNPDLVGFPFPLIILTNPGAETASFHADNRVSPRVEVRLTFKHFNPKNIFLQFATAAGKGCLYDVAQESAKPP